MYDKNRETLETNTEAIRFLASEIWNIRELTRDMPDILRRLERAGL